MIVAQSTPQERRADLQAKHEAALAEAMAAIHNDATSEEKTAAWTELKEKQQEEMAALVAKLEEEASEVPSTTLKHRVLQQTVVWRYRLKNLTVIVAVPAMQRTFP